MGSLLDEEILSINAIYAEDTLCHISEKPVICSLALPGEHNIALRLEFPSDYPDAPPSILGTQSVGDHVPKGFGSGVVDVARDVLGQVYVAGSPCIYDLVEELSTQLQQLLPPPDENAQIAGQPKEELGPRSNGQDSVNASSATISDQAQASQLLLEGEPSWIMSETFTEKKSVFVARATRVTSKEQAESFLRHLLATNKAVSQATHNITAWRMHGDGNTAIQDCDDDGETAAGGRLLRLLQLMDAWDVLVVVSRWYGGVQLGPARFRIINSVARDVIIQGEFAKDDSKDTDKNSSKTKKGGKK
ncbi:UPF0029-domain-containing protein [Myriangium duriaei CBS 260.36]|uniref:UPF0029-domain-containing protein n=1 Tax=Myriangium duriaei CBS 260.36 TaxID=1168546 RepID=A0A9P4MMZ4_9PEZI|nr:UPF0029-domain-containing protein [Myriangium duriaei CBS 260.36]